jgi:hypothetical protein
VAHVPDAYIAAVHDFFPQWTVAALMHVRACSAQASTLAAVTRHKLEPLVCRTSFKQRARSPITRATGTQKVRLADIKIAFGFSQGQADGANYVVAQILHKNFLAAGSGILPAAGSVLLTEQTRRSCGWAYILRQPRTQPSRSPGSPSCRASTSHLVQQCMATALSEQARMLVCFPTAPAAGTTSSRWTPCRFAMPPSLLHG